MIVREVARELPDHVDGVALFGSPIIGGPTHTIAARAFDPAEAALARAALEALDAERPVRVPFTSIYSRNDRVVNWKACVDRVTPSAKHVEVGSSHFGLLVDPDVWLAVAVALASNLATCAARVHPCAYSGISAGVAVAYRDRIVFQLRHSLASPVMRRASQM